MKRFFIFSLILLTSYISGFSADYTVKSQYISNPDLNIDFVIKNSDFWIKHAYDSVSGYGGFYSNIDRYGNITYQPLSSTKYYRKSLVSQSRLAYSFSRAFMLTGNENYLKYAQHALDFLFKYGWDYTNDGWFTFAKADGSIDYSGYWVPDNAKWGFQQHYALLGIIANYEVTRDDNVKAWMDKGISTLDQKMWDSRSGYEGYFTDADKNWANPRGKGFTPTVDGITTNAELLYLITQTPEHKNRFFRLTDGILDHLVAQMDNNVILALYPEVFDSNWNLLLSTNDQKKGSIGHFLKTSWCLARAYLCDTNYTQYKDAAIRILDESWTYQNGTTTIWDHVNGGPFNEIDVTTGKFWTGTGTNKDYWTVEQGFTAPMINYYITKNPIYLQMADESLDFHMKYFVDSEYGETYSTLDATGTTVKNPVKGDDFKAGYHSNELGYYAYLYSKLFYLDQPVNLYYQFARKTEPQSISVNPIGLPEGKLRIKSVTLDDANFTNFDADTRTLNLSANQGGIFKVTFEMAGVSSGNTQYLADNAKIYPNPTKGMVQISGVDDIKRIFVVDLAGKIVSELLPQATLSQKYDLSALNSGVYFISIEKNNGQVITKKIVKQ